MRWRGWKAGLRWRRSSNASRSGRSTGRTPCRRRPPRCAAGPPCPPCCPEDRAAMRIGLMVGSDKERPRAERLAGLVSDAVAAESAGFSSFWFPQVPGYLDALTAVALVGAATRTMEIGTAVVPIQTRHPVILAQQALTTQVACA